MQNSKTKNTPHESYPKNKLEFWNFSIFLLLLFILYLYKTTTYTAFYPSKKIPNSFLNLEFNWNFLSLFGIFPS